MPSLKRKFADIIGRVLGAYIIPFGRVGDWVENRFIGKLLSELEVDCVFDVGANKGQFGQLLRSSGFRGNILSFEPGLVAFTQLQDVAQRDGKWHAFNLALGETEGTLPLHVMRDDVFSSFRMPTQDEDQAFGNENQVETIVEVDIRRIKDLYDDLVLRFGFARPFLKLDTQGFDLEIIRGAGQRLDHFVGLSSEIAVRRLYVGSPTMAQSIQAISETGFDFVNLLRVHPDRLLNPLEFNSYAVRRDLMN